MTNNEHLSRNEKILRKMLGEDIELDEPQSRIEVLLTQLLGIIGGGSVSPEDIQAAIEEYLNTHDADIVTEQELSDALAGKVDKKTGRSLMTADEHTKLDGIESGAEANVQSDWNQSDTTADDFIKNKPDLSVYAPATFDLVADAHMSYNGFTSNGTTYPNTYTLLKNANDYRFLIVRSFGSGVGGYLWEYITVPSPKVTTANILLRRVDISGTTLTEYIFGLKFSADGTTITITYGQNDAVAHILIWGIK